DEVPRAVGLRLQVEAVVIVGGNDVRNAPRHANAVVLERGDLGGVVREETHRANGEAGQHVRGDGVVALVVTKAEREVRVDRVEAAVLERVCPNLVEQTDAAPLLPKIEEN